jgi:hypothetical protein
MSKSFPRKREPEREPCETLSGTGKVSLRRPGKTMDIRGAQMSAWMIPEEPQEQGPKEPETTSAQQRFFVTKEIP